MCIRDRVKATLDNIMLILRNDSGLKSIAFNLHRDGIDARGKMCIRDRYFVGKDVAERLGYAKPLNALAAHVDEDDSLKRGLIDSMERMQETDVYKRQPMCIVRVLQFMNDCYSGFGVIIYFYK